MDNAYLFVMKALVCYWGLVRGFKYPPTYESHERNIWKVLNNQGIDFDVMLHTYNKDQDSKIFSIHNLRYVVIEDDQHIEKRILPRIRNVITPHYFHETHRMGLFKCWHSQQHLHDQIQAIKNEYDFVITLDIAQFFATPLPSNLKDFDMSKMYVSDFEEYGGYNPRFCMSNTENILFYLNKFNFILQNEEQIPDLMIDPNYQEEYIYVVMRLFGVSREQVTNIPNLHPEWQLKQYLDVVGKKQVCKMPFRYFRIRTDGEIVGMSQEDLKVFELYNVKVDDVGANPALE